MVGRFEMEVYKKTLYGRAGGAEAGQPQDRVSQQRPVQEAVEDS